MSLRQFTDAYIACALWSSAHGDGTPLDVFNADLSTDATARLEADAADFYAAHADSWTAAPDYGDGDAGHDFWLTRNRHGAGFWDRGLGDLGRTLTDAAHAYGECDLYIGDDGMIYTFPS